MAEQSRYKAFNREFLMERLTTRRHKELAEFKEAEKWGQWRAESECEDLPDPEEARHWKEDRWDSEMYHLWKDYNEWMMIPVMKDMVREAAKEEIGTGLRKIFGEERIRKQLEEDARQSANLVEIAEGISDRPEEEEDLERPQNQDEDEPGDDMKPKSKASRQRETRARKKEHEDQVQQQKDFEVNQHEDQVQQQKDFEVNQHEDQVQQQKVQKKKAKRKKMNK
jgi:hypothetical protein